MKRMRHGGDLSAAAKIFGTPADGWLDLSTGINPVAYPVGTLAADSWHRLPTATDEARLIDAARAYYGLPEGAAITAAPGTQAIIQWLPAGIGKSHVQVLGPTYEEHAASWRARGHDVDVIDDLAAVDGDIIVIVNPNNPDGRLVAPDTLLALADRQASRNGMLIVDEAFADVIPEISVTGTAGRHGLLILRSFGKFFGLAGVRLGFAIGSDADIGHLRNALGPWSVSGPALTLGTMALSDISWQDATRSRLNADAARLDELLSGYGMDILGGTSLYRLTRSDDAQTLYRKLGQAGILVRIFDAQPDWIRFGLPGTEVDWQRLEAALA